MPALPGRLAHQEAAGEAKFRLSLMRTPDPVSAGPLHRGVGGAFLPEAPSMMTDAGNGTFSGGFRVPAGLDLQAHTTDSVFLAVADLAVKSTGAASAVSVTTLDSGTFMTAVATDRLARALDQAQYDGDAGPCVESVRSSEVVEVHDVGADPRWPVFSAAALEEGIRGVLSLPMPLDGSFAASLNVYSPDAGAFTDGDREGLVGLVAFAASAITNLRLYEGSRVLVEQMQTAMQSRALIDQARGILMAEHRCDAEEAFQILRRTSQASNRKMRDLAREIVERTAASGAGPA